MDFCGKNTYSTKKWAETIRNKRLKSKRKADDLRIYVCKRCGKYHLTSLIRPLKKPFK